MTPSLASPGTPPHLRGRFFVNETTNTITNIPPLYKGEHLRKAKRERVFFIDIIFFCAIITKMPG